MTNTRTHHMSIRERQTYFQLEQKMIEGSKEGKTIRATVTDCGPLDALIPSIHGVIAEPLHNNDRKRVGSNHLLAVCRVPYAAHAELCIGDVIEVQVDKSVLVFESGIYHNCVYRRKIKSCDHEPVTSINLKPRDRNYDLSSN